MVGPRRANEEKETEGGKNGNQLTCKCQLGQDQQIQIFGLGSAQNRVGSVKVVVNIADLRRELETPDPHRCSLGVCRGYGVAAAWASGQRQDCDSDASATKDPAQTRGRRQLRITSALLSPGLSVADRVARVRNRGEERGRGRECRRSSFVQRNVFRTGGGQVRPNHRIQIVPAQAASTAHHSNATWGRVTAPGSRQPALLPLHLSRRNYSSTTYSTTSICSGVTAQTLRTLTRAGYYFCLSIVAGGTNDQTKQTNSAKHAPSVESSLRPFPSKFPSRIVPRPPPHSLLSLCWHQRASDADVGVRWLVNVLPPLSWTPQALASQDSKRDGRPGDPWHHCRVRTQFVKLPRRPNSDAGLTADALLCRFIPICGSAKRHVLGPPSSSFSSFRAT